MFNPFAWVSIETCVLVATCIVLGRIYIHKKWQVLKNLNIPHEPPSVKGLGNLGDLFKEPDSIFNADLKRKKKFGKLYGAYNGLNPEVTIADPNILQHIFIKEFSSFSNRLKSFRKINGKELNAGLNVVGNEQWRRLRNTLSPAFSSSKLKAMVGIIEECIDATISRLKKAVEKNEGRFDTKAIFGRLSLDVICSSAFGVDVVSQESKDGKPPKVVELAQKMFDISVAGGPWFLLVFMFPWIENILVLFNFSVFPRDCVNYFSKLVDVLINSRNKSKVQQRIDLMQVMLQAQISESDVKSGARKGLTKNEIVGNSMILMLAGYETTGNTMLFLAYNLATHKDIQEKVRKEIKESTKDGKLTYEAINGMKYLTMCLNESMRIYGALPRNSRICEKEIIIDGIHIPKGMTVNIPVYGFSHDPEYWDEPERFNPDRMEDIMSKIDPMIFQPFGAGPRNCVGMRFALLEIKIAFCKLLQEFQFDTCNDTPDPPLRMTFKASMKPKENVYLKVTPIK